MAGNPPEDKANKRNAFKTMIADTIALRPGEDEPAEGGLGPREIQTLRLESIPFKYAGEKENAIREHFDESATRYYQRVNLLVDNPVAWEHNNGEFGQTLSQLQRLRTSRQERRRVRREGWG